MSPPVWLMVGSGLLHFAATALAFRLLWLTKFRSAWIAVTVAMALMGVLKLSYLHAYFTQGSMPVPTLAAAFGEFSVSGFLLLGFILLVPLVRQVQRVNAELQESRSAFKDFAETSTDYLWALDQNLRFSYFSEEFVNATGFDANRLLGKTREEVGAPGADPEELQRHLDDLKAHRPFRDFEFCRENEAGDTIFISISGTPVFDDAGRFQGYRGTSRNVTLTHAAQEKLRLAEQERRESEARFRDFADSASDRFWETDEEHRFTFVADAEAEAIAPNANALLGQTRWSVIGADPETDPQWKAHLLDLNAHMKFKDFIFEHGLPDGTTKFFSVSGVPVFDASGVFKGYRGTARDVTRREQLLRMKDEFVSTVSHELRTPLTSIRGSLGLLSGDVVDAGAAEGQNLIDIALKNSDRLISLVDDLLDMEKLSSGSMEFTFEPVDLDELIEQSVRSNKSYADQFDVRVEVQAPGVGQPVVADKSRLSQVMANLISNAVKFSPAQGIVYVAARKTGERFRVEVSDQGPGVPVAFREEVFEKFTQADGSSAKHVKGTGLGLSICKAIIDAHGGEIGFDSEPGNGATFYFELPTKSDS